MVLYCHPRKSCLSTDSLTIFPKSFTEHNQHFSDVITVNHIGSYAMSDVIRTMHTIEESIMFLH